MVLEYITFLSQMQLIVGALQFIELVLLLFRIILSCLYMQAK